MIKKLVSFIPNVLDVLNRITEVLTYVATGYTKYEEKKEELEAKSYKWARYIILGAISGGIVLIVFLLVRAIVKKVKKARAKKLQKKLEKQLALEV